MKESKVRPAQITKTMNPEDSEDDIAWRLIAEVGAEAAYRNHMHMKILMISKGPTMKMEGF